MTTTMRMMMRKKRTQRQCGVPELMERNREVGLEGVGMRAGHLDQLESIVMGKMRSQRRKGGRGDVCECFGFPPQDWLLFRPADNMTLPATSSSSSSLSSHLPTPTIISKLSLLLILTLIIFISASQQHHFVSAAAAAAQEEDTTGEQQEQQQEPLHVHFVIHSHQDPGWLKTFDQYAKGINIGGRPEDTGATFDTFQSIEEPFVYQEMSFMEAAMEEFRKTDRPDLALQMLNRMEVVGGGWVLADEACPTYRDYLTNMQVGHQYVKALYSHYTNSTELEMNTLWNIDPFGHSRTISLDMALAMGVKYVVLNRINKKLKNELKNAKELEYYWCRGENACVLAHILDDHYDPPCKNELSMDATRASSTPLSSERSIQSTAECFSREVMKRSKFYKTNQILIPYGDDFTHKSKIPIDNLKKVVEYLKKNPSEREMKFQFSTLSQYFQAVEKEMEEKSIHLRRVLDDQDYFPYTQRSEDNGDYWTGYYTSHPTFKRQVRYTSNFFKTAQVFSALHMIQDANATTDSTTWHQKEQELDEMGDSLLKLSRELSLTQHHDAITGTSKGPVRADYRKRLDQAVGDSKQKVLEKSLGVLVGGTEDETLYFLKEKEVLSLDDGSTRPLIIVNNLHSSRSTHISVRVSVQNLELYTINEDANKRQKIPFDLLPLSESETEYELVFLAKNVPAFGFRTFFLSHDSSLQSVNIASSQEIANGTTTLENDFFRLEIRDFSLQFMALRDEGTNAPQTVSYSAPLNITHKLMAYSYLGGDPSEGAYVFHAENEASEVLYSSRNMTLIRGELIDEVRLDTQGSINEQSFPFRIVYRIFKSGSSVSSQDASEDFGFVDVLIQSDITQEPYPLFNLDLISRFETSILNGEDFFTDANGYEILKRTRLPEMAISRNYYPATEVTWIRDGTHQFSLLLNQAHGVSSQANGTLEVMLARESVRDDGKGVGEKLRQDTKPTVSQFRLVLTNHKNDLPSTESSIRRMARSFDHEMAVVAVQSEQQEYERSHRLVYSPVLPSFDAKKLYVLTFAPFTPIHMTSVQSNSTAHQDSHSTYILRLQNLDQQTPLQNVNLDHLFQLPSMVNVTEWTASLLKQKKPHFSTEKISFSPNEIRTFLVRFKQETEEKKKPNPPPPQPEPKPEPEPEEKDPSINQGESIIGYLLGVMLALCFTCATIVLIIFFVVGSLRRGWMKQSTQTWLRLNQSNDMDDEIPQFQLSDSENEGAIV